MRWTLHNETAVLSLLKLEPIILMPVDVDGLVKASICQMQMFEAWTDDYIQELEKKVPAMAHEILYNCPRFMGKNAAHLVVGFNHLTFDYFLNI